MGFSVFDVYVTDKETVTAPGEVTLPQQAHTVGHINV